MNSFLVAITDLGDSAVLIALTLTVTVYLFWARSYRAAWTMTAAFLTAGALIGLLKLVVMSCGAPDAQSAIQSPSGHAALATAILGTLAVIVAGQMRDWWRWLPLAVATLLVTGIAATRILLRVHTPEDVVIGLLVGGLVTAGSYLTLRRHAAPRFQLRGLLLAAAFTAFALHGVRLPAEHLVRQLASELRSRTTSCGDVIAARSIITASRWSPENHRP